MFYLVLFSQNLFIGCDEEYDANSGEKLPREYLARLWARREETIRFHIEFHVGSHVVFSWMLEDDGGVHVAAEDEYCVTTAEGQQEAAADILEEGFDLDDAGEEFCVFPFRYKVHFWRI